MTKSIADIISSKWEEPPEIEKIKDYVRKNFKASVGVKISPKQIVINAPSSALAASLRMQIYDLEKRLKTDKKLVIRISR